ncbi:MAG: hypothetical protein ABIP49_01050, partial [Lysobacterales bacterium]
MRPLPADLFNSARHYLYALDLAGERADVLDVDRDFFAAPFLDERALSGTQIGGWRYPLGDLLAAHAARNAPQRAASWIFHVGHCGSTLLSRLLDRIPSVLGVREPLPLLSLAQAMMERDSPLGRVNPQQVDATLGCVAELLTRRFTESDRIIVKATSSTSLLAPALLTTRPLDRAVLMDLPLRRYLAVYLRDPALRAQARADALPRLATWHAWTGDDSLRLWQLDDAQCIAFNWRVDTERFARLTADPGTSAQVLRLDGEIFIGDPVATLERVAVFLGLPYMFDATGPRDSFSEILSRYAKQPAQAFDAAARGHELQAAESLYRAEIDHADAWL